VTHIIAIAVKFMRGWFCKDCEV